VGRLEIIAIELICFLNLYSARESSGCRATLFGKPTVCWMRTLGAHRCAQQHAARSEPSAINRTLERIADAFARHVDLAMLLRCRALSPAGVRGRRPCDRRTGRG